MPSTSRLALLLSFAVLAFGAVPVGAQEFPVKPIRIIVNNAPGIITDIVARTLATGLSKFIGQPVLVENKAGANGVIGYEYVAKQAPADGYTLIVGSISQLAILPWITKDLRFNPLRDLVTVIGLGKGPYYFVSTSMLPWKSFNEVVAFARANPGKLNYGSSGATTRLVTEAIVRSVGLNVVFVPYRAGADYQKALIVNEVQVGMLQLASILAARDKVLPLAVTGKSRSAALPNVPTLAELGIPNIPGTSYELDAPAGTSKAVIARLYAAGLQVLQDPDVKARLAKLGLDVVAESPETAADRFVEEARLFGDIAKAIGLQPE